MLVLGGGVKHITFLSTTIKALQDAAFISSLRSAGSAEEIVSQVAAKFDL